MEYTRASLHQMILDAEAEELTKEEAIEVVCKRLGESGDLEKLVKFALLEISKPRIVP